MSFLLEGSTVLSTITSLLSTGTSVAANVMQGQVDASNAEERAITDRFNAEVADQQARSALEGAAADVEDFRRVQSARVAASRAMAAGSGFTMEGSPMLVDKAALTNIEFGVSRILHRGRVEATRLRQGASLLRRSATVEEINAGLAKRGGLIGGISAAVKGVSNTLATGGVKFG